MPRGAAFLGPTPIPSLLALLHEEIGPPDKPVRLVMQDYLLVFPLREPIYPAPTPPHYSPHAGVHNRLTAWKGACRIDVPFHACLKKSTLPHQV